MTLTIALLVVSAIGLVARFRRSSGVLRQQMKWFVFAGALAAVALPVSFAGTLSFPSYRGGLTLRDRSSA